MLSDPVLLSIVVPIFNEEETIAPLLDEIAEACRGAEIIVVDDGSTDRSAKVLADWQKQNDRPVQIISLRENSGQGTALYTGLKAARGEIIITLDGDGQNDPADIPDLLDLDKLDRSDCDLVVGIREGRRDTWLRRWMSKIANAVRSRLLGDGVSDAGCALKAMRREVVSALIPMQTLYSFVPALVAGGGFRVGEIPVTHRERQGGRSHYSLRKMLWRPLLDMLGVCWFNRRRCKAQPVSASRLAPGVTLVFVGAAFFAFLGNHGLFEPDEGRYAQVAKEMSESGNLITPTLNGFSHIEKPPVIYWFVALSYRVFGVSEFGARLPSALAALGMIFLTFQIAKELGGRRAGWFAALVLASSLQFFLMARLITADMMMAFWITAAITCAVKFHFHPTAKAYGWLFFVFMGVGFLTKGPMALLVPISAAAGLGWKNNDRPRLPWLLGMPLCLAISISWFVIVSVQNPNLFDYFLRTELLDRFLSNNHGRNQPIWFFLPVLIVGFLPWTLFLIPALLAQFKRGAKLAPPARFLLTWFLIPLLFLSLSGSKLVTYVLPLLPALATGLGLAFSSGLRPNRITMRALGIGAIALAAVMFALRRPGHLHIHIDTHMLCLVAIAAAGGLLVFLWSGKSSMTPQRISALSISSTIVWLAIASQADRANHLLGRQASMRQIAGTLSQQELSPNTWIIASNIRAHSLEFYLDRLVNVTEGQADLILVPSEAQARRLHRSSKTVAQIKQRKAKSTFVVTRTGDWEKHFKPDGRWITLDRSGDFLLLELPVRQNVAMRE